MENGAPDWVSHSASAEAIFIGCCSNMILAWKSPETTSTTAEMNMATTPKRTAGRNTLRLMRLCSAPSTESRPSWRALLWWRTMCQPATPVTKAEATSQAPEITWGNAASVVTLVRTERMEPWEGSSSARPVSGFSMAPTGCCMKEFAAMMKYAESMVPIATIQMVSRWIFSGSLFQPKIHSPRNTDSRKNASRPSRARGAPNTSPT